MMLTNRPRYKNMPSMQFPHSILPNFAMAGQKLCNFDNMHIFGPESDAASILEKGFEDGQVGFVCRDVVSS